MKAIVTGGAGFIASHLNDLLLSKGWGVTAVDRIAPESAKNIEHLRDCKSFDYVCMDITNIEKFVDVSKDADIIFHLAANSDIQNGGNNPNIDYNDTLLTTRSVLESMRINKIGKLFFSSTSAVYGMKTNMALNEKTGDLRPISYYGAAKLASESLISAYSYMCSFDALIFRFPNVVGPRLTHGVIFDFVKKLNDNPDTLTILGNGKQNKEYVYVIDLVKGIVNFIDKPLSGVNIFNISTESSVNVDTIADIICEKMKLPDVKYEYTGGNCGWKGDVPSFDYDISKAKSAGWEYDHDSIKAIEKTVEAVLKI